MSIAVITVGGAVIVLTYTAGTVALVAAGGITFLWGSLAVLRYSLSSLNLRCAPNNSISPEVRSGGFGRFIGGASSQSHSSSSNVHTDSHNTDRRHYGPKISSNFKPRKNY